MLPKGSALRGHKYYSGTNNEQGKRVCLVLKKTVICGLILIFTVFSLMQAVPIIEAGTQTGFILASAGKDGQIGTGDDIVATESEKAVKGIPANISATDAVLSAALGVQSKALRQPNSDEIAIRKPEELAKIGVDPSYPLNGKYVLMSDLDLSGYSNWVPVGSSPSTPFSGQFDGNGFVIMVLLQTAILRVM